jgi:dTDP-glucose pyrophosphorylase/CBS domain-containing protein
MWWAARCGVTLRLITNSNGPIFSKPMTLHNHRARLAKIVVSPQLTVREALARLDNGGIGVLAVCCDSRKLLGVLTDGDFRRAILQRCPLDRPCGEIASKDPLVAPDGVTPQGALQLMDAGRPFLVNQLPVLDGEGRLVDLWLRRDLVVSEPEMQAVIMAGGFGTRLLPLTKNMPKPMLQVGDRPVMQHLIEQMRGAGIEDVNVTTHYMPEKINDYFGDGERFGVRLKYVDESQPLGTAGAIGLLKRPEKPTLVVNGDILTRVDFRAMLTFHLEHRAALTVGVRQYDIEVPYGVLECDGSRVRKISEKPSYTVFVNAGIYILEPQAYDRIPAGQRFDMTDLIDALLRAQLEVVSFPIIEYWLDIGQPADYEQAQVEISKDTRLER